MSDYNHILPTQTYYAQNDPLFQSVFNAAGGASPTFDNVTVTGTLAVDGNLNSNDIILNPTGDGATLWVTGDADIIFRPAAGAGFDTTNLTMSTTAFSGYPSGTVNGVSLSGTQVNGSPFLAGTFFVYGSGGNTQSTNIPAVDASGSKLNFLASGIQLNGTDILIPPAPRYFNWSANNPGGSMLLGNQTLDVTTNVTVNAGNLYRVSFEVYMVQITPATGLISIYSDTSPIDYAVVIPTSSITSALDFRASYTMLVRPSDTTFKMLVNNSSNQNVNLTWLPILLEDLGPEPAAPTG
jgi:hypothetical protein